MMKKSFRMGLTSILFAALVFVSCSKMPQKEIDAAKQAVDSAKIAGADIYLMESYVLLQDSMDAVMEGIEAKKSKFFASYKSSIKELEGVRQYAKEITQQVELRKEELRVEINTTITDAEKLIEANRNLILEAPRGKEGTSALEAIKQEIGAIETSITNAKAMLANDDLMAALDKSKAAHSKAVSINDELNTVIAKYKANVMKRR